MGRVINRHYPYWMLIPMCLLILIFFYIPTVQGIYYSFTNWNLNGTPTKLIGWDNYSSFFTDDRLKLVFKNTFIFTAVTTVFKTLIGLLLALLVNQIVRFRSLLQTIFFAPVVLSNIAVGLIFVALLHPTNGFVNKFLIEAGLGSWANDWLHTPDLALYSVAAIEVWKYSGFVMIIFIAGLQTIPHDYYEAAKIDGASAGNRFFRITLPLLMPAFTTVLILNIIGGLRVFDMIYVMTGGGPGSASQVINTWIFKEYGAGRLGSSSAGVVILSGIVAVISLTVNSVLRKREVEY